MARWDFPSVSESPQMSRKKAMSYSRRGNIAPQNLAPHRLLTELGFGEQFDLTL